MYAQSMSAPSTSRLRSLGMTRCGNGQLDDESFQTCPLAVKRVYLDPAACRRVYLGGAPGRMGLYADFGTMP